MVLPSGTARNPTVALSRAPSQLDNGTGALGHRCNPLHPHLCKAGRAWKARIWSRAVRRFSTQAGAYRNDRDQPKRTIEGVMENAVENVPVSGTLRRRTLAVQGICSAPMPIAGTSSTYS